MRLQGDGYVELPQRAPMWRAIGGALRHDPGFVTRTLVSAQGVAPRRGAPACAPLEWGSKASETNRERI